MKGLHVNVATNAPALAKHLRELGKSQIPFATAVTLTRLAQAAQAANRARLPQVFHLRRSNLGGRLKVVRAEKRDWPYPRAILGFGQRGVDEFWSLQELGGTKRARGGRVAVPSSLVKRTASGKVRTAQRPRAILEKKGGFEKEGAILGRFGRSKARVFYFLRSRVKIKPTLGARQTSTDVSRRLYATTFDRELRTAIRSARVRQGSFDAEAARLLYLKASREP